MNANIPPQSVNALTLSTIADNEQFASIVHELLGLRTAESETARNSAETILDSTLKQALLIAKAKTLTDKLEKERRPNVEKFAELIGYSYGMARKYLDLEKAYIKAEKEGRNIETFKELNRSVIANGKRPIYGIQAFTEYLNGLDIYRSSIAKEAEKAQRKAEKEAEKAEKEAEKEEEKKIKEAEKVNELRNSVLNISMVSMNGLIKEDIQVKIHATNNDKPVILSSVRSSELQKAFDIIINLVQKAENKAVDEISGKVLDTEKEFKAKGQKAVINKKIKALQDEQASKLALADSLREAMMG
jgi:hypothetical protein